MNEQQKTDLMGPIPREAITTREGAGGAQLDYVTGEYVMRRMLEILGPDGWSSQFVIPPMVRNLSEVKNDAGHVTRVVVTADATVRLAVGSVQREDVGVGVATAKSHGEAIEMALKTASTDAFKRAARQLGNAVGLALYDKEQRNIAEPKGRGRGDSEAMLTVDIDSARSQEALNEIQVRIRKAAPKLGPEVTKALVARWRTSFDRLAAPTVASNTGE